MDLVFLEVLEQYSKWTFFDYILNDLILFKMEKYCIWMNYIQSGFFYLKWIVSIVKWTMVFQVVWLVSKSTILF